MALSTLTMLGTALQRQGLAATAGGLHTQTVLLPTWLLAGNTMATSYEAGAVLVALVVTLSGATAVATAA